MTERTVRELAGEIWAEMTSEITDDSMPSSALKSMEINTLHRVVDVIMGVLARHDNTVIVNDKDLPVTPLPKRFVD